MEKTILNPLTPEEKSVIIDKGTERPFVGEYTDFFEPGTYFCKQCSAPLYRSESKFHSECGRPSFDDAIPGAIKWTTDADGSRTEITCNNCGGHLGHVFIGEHETEKNTRYCVNSISMVFKPDVISEAKLDTAVLGGGCFWCLEAAFGDIKGVVDVKSGYSGGQRQFPTYEQVCSGNSGHIEVVQIVFDPSIISYKQLLEIFFTIHDPTTLDRQGGDSGEQYKSIIFTHSGEQKKIAEETISELSAQHIRNDPIVTVIRPLEKFWIAEEYHQHYFANNPNKPYCQIVINPKLSKLREKWSGLLKE